MPLHTSMYLYTHAPVCMTLHTYCVPTHTCTCIHDTLTHTVCLHTHAPVFMTRSHIICTNTYMHLYTWHIRTKKLPVSGDRVRLSLSFSSLSLHSCLSFLRWMLTNAPLIADILIRARTETVYRNHAAGAIIQLVVDRHAFKIKCKMKTCNVLWRKDNGPLRPLCRMFP